MPSKSYSNADLNDKLARISPISGKSYRQGLAEDGVDEFNAAQDRQPSIPSPDPLDGRAETERLLSEARGTLSHANQMSQENNTSNLMNLESRLASLSQGPRPSFSNAVASATGPLADVGHGLQAASLPAAFGGPVPAMALMGAGSALTAPDILRRLIAPREAEPNAAGGLMEDESRTGAAIEGALNFAPAAISKLRAPSPYTGWRPRVFGQGGETAYQNTVPAVDPNQVINLAHEIAAETGVPVEKVLKGYTRSGGAGVKEQGSAIMRLLNSGRQAEAPVAGEVDDLAQFASGPRINRGLGNGASVTPQSMNYEPGNFDEMATSMRDRTGSSDALRRLLGERNQTGPHTLAPSGRMRGGQ